MYMYIAFMLLILMFTVVYGTYTCVYVHAGVAMICSNEERIKAMFSALLLNVQDALQSKDVNINKVRQFLVNFLQCEEFLPKMVSTFDKMFTATTINGLWSYQHYSPLERLTDHFLPDDPVIDGFMRDYKSNLTGFFLTTKLVDYMEYNKLQADDSDDDSEQLSILKKYTLRHYRKIKVKLELNRKVSELSLAYVHKLWHSLADEYELPSLTAIVDQIVMGSLEITWQVLPHVLLKIKPRARFFRSHQIIQVFIDNIVVYDERQMVCLCGSFQRLLITFLALLCRLTMREDYWNSVT